MEKFQSLWAKRVPKYNVEYAYLFEKLALKGNGDQSEERQSGKGLIFRSNYEFYMYAFFLGVYNGYKIPLNTGKDAVDFGWAIENWGQKSKDSERKDFSNLQKYIFSILVAQTDINFINLEISEEEKDIKDAVGKLINLMGEYTNNGLQIIKEKDESNPNYFYSSTLAPLKLLMDIVKKADTQ